MTVLARQDYHLGEWQRNSPTPSNRIRKRATMLKKSEMGRFSVDLIIANNRDAVNLGDGDSVLEHVKHTVVSGVLIAGPRDSSCRNASWTNFT